MAERVGEDGSSSGDDDDEFLAHFLESEILSGDPDPATAPHKEEAPDAAEAVARPSKRIRVESESSHAQRSTAQIDSGFFSKIPPELFHSIFKFLSSEQDLISCSLVCRFMNFAASDEKPLVSPVLHEVGSHLCEWKASGLRLEEALHTARSRGHG